jgi:hypothetical protein
MHITWPRSAVAAIAAAIVGAIWRAQIDPSAAALFVVWLALVLWPIGSLVAAACRFGGALSAAERVAIQFGLGVVTVSVATMFGSILAGTIGVRVAVFGLAVAGLFRVARSHGRGAPPRGGIAWVTTLAAAATLAHLMLLPPYFSGVDDSGALVIAGIGGDGFYLPLAQQVARTGRLAENPFYAGQAMLYHHFLSDFLVAGYWITTPGAPAPFAARLLFHFLLGTPLLIAMVAILLARWTRSAAWTALLLALFVLPVTAYPTHGVGWEGIESMNAFWVIGIHGDLGYLLGLIAMLLLVLVIDIAADDQNADWRWLAAAQVVLAAATQFKLNFVLGYGVAAELAILAVAFRAGGRVLASTAFIGVAALATVQAGALLMSTISSGRTLAFKYGFLAHDKLLGAITGNAADGLAALAAVVDAVHGPLQPVVIVTAYCLAYTPLFAATLVHSVAALRRAALTDRLLAGTALGSLVAVLWLVEGGNGTANSWNIAAHLHYLVPCLAVASAARLLGRAPNTWGFRTAAALSIIVALSATMRMIGDGVRFEFWRTWKFDDRELVAFLRAVDRSTPRDAVLLRGALPADLPDEYVAMMTNRSLFISNSYAYIDLQPDAAARRSLAMAVRDRWPGVVPVAREQLIGLSGTRPLIAVGMVPADAKPPSGAHCVKQYCFWEL